MPFDGTGFPPERSRPQRRPLTETVLCTVIVLLAVGLLIVPISLPALVDLVRYLRG